MPSEYVLDQARGGENERRRLALVESYQDPPTRRQLEALGVGPGWRCLDAGAGGGSVARWMAERVGPAGSVLATDLDTTLLEEVPTRGVRPLRHDVRSDALPVSAFDLVHARLLLIHVPERVEVLRTLRGAVRPGGWLVIGDIDFSSVAPLRPVAEWDAVSKAFLGAVHEAGWEPELGPRLPGMLSACELCDVEAEAWRHVQRGGSAVATILALTYERLRPALLAHGRVGAGDLDAVIASLQDPNLAFSGPTLWTAWGRAGA
jgi:SAM-dependent methyltransferase